MLKEIGELSRDFLQGKVKQNEYLPAVGAVLNAKQQGLSPLRDSELLDFAKKFAHFA